MRIHCIGIGGAGMSGLARILWARGHRVTGEDAEESPFLDDLREAGIPVRIGPGGDLPRGTETVVRSAAVPLDHPSVREAEVRNLRVRKYAEALGIASFGQRTLAVAGTHGKTTTTALLSHILTQAGKDPSFLVGGTLPHLGGSARAGTSDLFVVEACEYDRSFLHLSPNVAILTNVEADHLDCYGDLDGIVEAFGEFVEKIPSGGLLLIPHGDAAAARAATRARCPVETFRIGGAADWTADGINRAPQETSFRLIHRGEDLGRCRIPVPGRHNVLNSLAAAGVCHFLGLGIDEIRRGLASFRTVDRRFQVIRSDPDLAVISDYAHHPTEIRSVLDACGQAYPDRRRLIVFQPHQAFRTRVFLDRFAEALAGDGKVLLAPIYAAREGGAENGKLIQGLADRIVSGGGEAAILGGLDTIPPRVSSEIREGDVVLVLGAGDIYKVVHPISELLPRNGASRKRVGSPMFRDLTTFRIGGASRHYARPGCLTELRSAVREAHGRDLPVLYVGGGSNLVPRGETFEGTVIDIRGMNRLRSSRLHVIAQAGVSLARTMRVAERLSLSGLEPLAGIPGTLGGAVAMNAGGRHGSISDVVDIVGMVMPDGSVVYRRREDLRFRYRGCDTGGGVIFEVVLRLRRGQRHQIRRRSAEIMKGKRRTQPYGVPSAGCIFRNPEGDAAGRLIDAAGLKGHRIGGAMVSMLHANFIVNDGDATSADVIGLIEHVRETVKDRFGVNLELEVKVV